MRESTVTANGIEFAYLEQGSGPLVLLLHGFPDTAHTWSHVMPALANAGYRAVAPFTRGYPPTSAGEYYDSGTLATDARALIHALGEERAHVVGHDWGGATTYYLCAAFPDAVARAVTLAIPHPYAIAGSFLSPRAIHAVFHFWFFQMPFLPETAVAANDFEFIDYLWSLWSPGFNDPEQIANVKRALAVDGALTSAIGYYRAMFDPAKQDPATAEVRQALATPIATPLMVLYGANDRALTVAPEMKGFFSGEFRQEIVEGAGHFLHRERPQDVERLILDWLAR